MNDSSYAKTTIVSANPIRTDQANGILMRSLFQGWPPSRLSQIYFPLAVTNEPDRSLCEQFRLIRFSGRTVKIPGSTQTRPGRTLGQSHESTDRPSRRAGEGQEKTSGSHHSGQLKRTLTNLITRQSQLMKFLRYGTETWYSQSHLGRILESQLRELQPDCVYALLGNYCLTKITLQACQRLGLPLHIHITDDFVTSMYREFPFSRRITAASERWMASAVGYANGLSAISPVMAEDFEQRYGRPWDWFTTLISAEDYDPTPRKPDGTLRLVYAGSLGLRRWESLAQLARSLDQFRKRTGRPAVLEIYGSPTHTAQYREALTVSGVTQLKGWAAPDQLPGIFQAADVLVHVESFDAAMADYTKLSFSTKLSQYMMAGRPVLAIGPADLGSLEMVRRTQSGVTLSDPDPEEFSEQLAAYLTHPARQREHAKKGRQWAEEWVDRQHGHARFRKSIQKSACIGKPRIAA